MNQVELINGIGKLQSLISRRAHVNQETILKELKEIQAACHESMDHDSESMLLSIMSAALQKKYSSIPLEVNIYSKRYDTPQIELFDILINEFPFVRHSQNICNQMIIESAKNCSELTIIDIGIGLGTQMIHITQALKENITLQKLRIIGIEPFGDAIQSAELSFQKLAKDFPFELEFIGFNEYVENFNFSQFRDLNGIVIVNASLALHHIQSTQERNKCIQSIHALNPALFLLIEPNVDHYTNDILSRLQNCYSHFMALFQVIDELLISRKEKDSLKMFFGREIEDILSKEEKDRFEKHEPAINWVHRLLACGFKLTKPFTPITRTVEAGVKIELQNEGFIGLNYGNEMVLSIICAN